MPNWSSRRGAASDSSRVTKLMSRARNPHSGVSDPPKFSRGKFLSRSSNDFSKNFSTERGKYKKKTF